MADFRSSLYAEPLEFFVLPKGKKISLIQFGGDRSGTKLELDVQPPDVLDLTVLDTSLPSASTAFEIEGKSQGQTAYITAYIAGTNKTRAFTHPLRVTVGGEPKMHTSYEKDLLYNFVNKANTTTKLEMYGYILSTWSNGHVLGPNTTKGQFDCGDIAGKGYSKLLGMSVVENVGIFYLPAKSSVLTELRFNAGRVGTCIQNIKKFIDQGRLVRLHAVHSDGLTFPTIMPTPHTHFITVFGYATDKFMFFNPWPDGSSMPYSGGVIKEVESPFMGELSWDPAKLELGIKVPNPKPDEQKLLVYEGP